MGKRKPQKTKELSVAIAEAEASSAGGESQQPQPTPRKRGRPRKIVEKSEKDEIKKETPLAAEQVVEGQSSAPPEGGTKEEEPSAFTGGATAKEAGQTEPSLSRSRARRKSKPRKSS